MSVSFTPDAASPEYVRDMAAVTKLTADQRNLLCDLGYCNEVFYGYLILAMQGAGFSREDINKAITALYYALDENNAEEAAQVYKDF